MDTSTVHLDPDERGQNKKRKRETAAEPGLFQNPPFVFIGFCSCCKMWDVEVGNTITQRKWVKRQRNDSETLKRNAEHQQSRLS